MNYWLIIRLPILIAIGVNFLIFIRVICIIISKLQANLMCKTDTKCRLAKSTLTLIPLLGTHEVIFAFVTDEHARGTLRFVKLFCELSFNSFQGLMVAILYCFINNEHSALSVGCTNINTDGSNELHLRELSALSIVKGRAYIRRVREAIYPLLQLLGPELHYTFQYNYLAQAYQTSEQRIYYNNLNPPALPCRQHYVSSRSSPADIATASYRRGVIKLTGDLSPIGLEHLHQKCYSTDAPAPMQVYNVDLPLM
ncbi:Glucagon-like peptide 1 receptor [Chelonia mydas]|uniref:Glucagon-like peptide 1 receptor n=1 Tax=Chelonia mydas TaxID=8469 RepID=M7AP10_CHEMY|nr:Glucagon-like peptide 1 receptor [Chelonia mydas]